MSLCGDHRTRVATVTLDNMAEDTITASASLRQILTVPVRYRGPAFASWLPMLWDTLTRNPELQWFGISPQFRLKVSRGDEGVGHVCFPGDEGKKIWWLCLVPTSTTRFASDVGYRMAKIWYSYIRKIFLWTLAYNSLTENGEHNISSQILKTILDCMPQLFFRPQYVLFPVHL